MRQSPERLTSPQRRHRGSPPQQQQQRRRTSQAQDPDAPTPICRCRVLYLGSAVPHMTKDGLQGIQEPLKELYPEDGALGAKGIDSWLSVWSNGFLLENMDENQKKVTRFFPVESLHYCAAVRYVMVPGSTPEKVARFLPLDSPFARQPSITHPPLFAAILRRTSGIKVLECHVFICKRETAANALVRCAFHAYADSTYAKHLESSQSLYGTLNPMTPPSAIPPLMRPETPREYQQSVIDMMSEDSINSIEKADEWKDSNGSGSPKSPPYNNNNNIDNNNVSKIKASPKVNGLRTNGNSDESSILIADENHKVWVSSNGNSKPDSPDGIYDYSNTMRSFRSSASVLSSSRQRPRQMIMPASPPPPPIPEEDSSSGGKENNRKQRERKKKRSKSRDKVDGSADRVNGVERSASVLGNGDGYGPYSQRMMNGGGYPRGLPPPHPPPVMMIPMSRKKAGTFSARQKGMSMPIPPFMMYGGPPPQFGMPYGPPPPGYYGPPPGPGHPGSRIMEEPIYMPHNTRPISPMASYQPGHFPHEAYYRQQQYATIDRSSRLRGVGRGKPSSKSGGSKASSSKDSKGKANNHQQLSSDSNAEDSEFGPVNGKKSRPYAMRRDQRSKSHGSLANMQFGPNGEPIPDSKGIHPYPGMKDVKREQDLMQIMGDLDLGDDTIERSEVPPGFYPPGQPPNMMYSAPLPPLPPMMAAGDTSSHRRQRRN